MKLRPIIAVVLLSVLLAASSEASLCSKILSKDYWTFKPDLELSLRERSNGEKVAYLLKDTRLPAQIINRLLALFSQPLKMNLFASAMSDLEKSDPSLPYFTRVIAAFKTELIFDPAELENIPKTGALIAFGNHPLSAIDAFSIGALIEKVRDDVKVVAAEPVAHIIPQFREHAILVDPMRTEAAKVKNREAVSAMNQQLIDEKTLMILPAGRVSAYTEESPTRAVDREWQKGILQSLRKNPHAKMVPFFIEGEPSDLFLKVQKHAPAASNALLASEMAKASVGPVRIRIGKPIGLEDIQGETDEEQLSFLRAKVYDLDGIR